MRLFSRSTVVGMVLGLAVLGVMETMSLMPEWRTIFNSATAPPEPQQAVVASDVPVSPPLPDSDFNTMPIGPDAAPNSLVNQALSIFSPYLLGNHERPPSQSATQLYPPPLPDAAAAATPPEASQAADDSDPPPRLPVAKAQPGPRTLKSLRESNESPAMFNEAQIASIKARLKLSKQQEQYWPPVEAALRAVSWQRHGKQKATLDLGSLQRLNEAARTMLTYLREDQKSEVKMLASIVGLKI